MIAVPIKPKPKVFTMTANKNTPSDASLCHALTFLKLSYTQEHFEALAQQAAEKQQSHVHYLNQLMEGEVSLRQALPSNAA